MTSGPTDGKIVLLSWVYFVLRISASVPCSLRITRVRQNFERLARSNAAYFHMLALCIMSTTHVAHFLPPTKHPLASDYAFSARHPAAGRHAEIEYLVGKKARYLPRRQTRVVDSSVWMCLLCQLLIVS